MKTYVLIMILLSFQTNSRGYAGGPAIQHVPFETLELCEQAIEQLHNQNVRKLGLLCVHNGGEADQS